MTLWYLKSTCCFYYTVDSHFYYYCFLLLPHIVEHVHFQLGQDKSVYNETQFGTCAACFRCGYEWNQLCPWDFINFVCIVKFPVLVPFLHVFSYGLRYEVFSTLCASYKKAVMKTDKVRRSHCGLSLANLKSVLQQFVALPAICTYMDSWVWMTYCHMLNNTVYCHMLNITVI